MNSYDYPVYMVSNGNWTLIPLKLIIYLTFKVYMVTKISFIKFKSPLVSCIGTLMYMYLYMYITSYYRDTLAKGHHQGRHGRDRMVVGFITTYVLSAYHH